MIDNKALPLSQQIADHFTVSNKKLAFRTASPFGELVTALATMDPKADDYMAQIINASIPMNSGDLDKHTFIKDKLSRHLSDTLNSIINYSKNYINVNIREIMEGVEQIKEMQESDDVSCGVKIKAHKMNNILQSAVLETFLDTVLNSGELVNMSANVFQELWNKPTVPELLKTMSTASDGFNQELTEFLSIYYPGESLRMLDFRERPVHNGIVSTFSQNADIINYLFLHGVYRGNHPTVSVESLSENDRKNLKLLINFWGSQILMRIERMGAISKQGDVILQADEATNTIHVQATAYTKWLSEGGTSDALIGYWLSTGKSSSAKSAELVTLNKEKFEDAYKRNQRMQMSNTQLKVNKAAERFIYEKVVGVIRRDISDESEKQELIKNANSFYANMNIASFESIDDYCRFMVCKTVGKDSDSLELLSSITSYRKNNPEASMDEAVFNAISELLVETVFSQIEVIDESIDIDKVISL